MGQDRLSEKRKEKKIFGETSQEKGAIKLSAKRYILPILFLMVVALTGCAALQEAITAIPTTDASAEISAIETIAGDYLDEPYNSGALMVIGYGLALLRRWYKKKQGAKDV